MATTLAPQQLPVLNNDEVLRYSRHLIMPEVGMEGQQKLKAARVLCIGTGGLGSPLALYLAAAGVGTIGLVDFERLLRGHSKRWTIGLNYSITKLPNYPMKQQGQCWKL